MKRMVITQTDGVIIIKPGAAFGITELEGVVVAILPDDVVIPVELVGNGIPPLLGAANVPVFMEEVAEMMALLETGEYEKK